MICVQYVVLLKVLFQANDFLSPDIRRRNLATDDVVAQISKRSRRAKSTVYLEKVLFYILGSKPGRIRSSL